MNGYTDAEFLAKLAELKGSILISGVIGQTLPLKRRGNEFEALCPFHREQTPSFTVVDDRGFFDCFGCGANGDVFVWLNRARHMSLPEAVAYLDGKTEGRDGDPVWPSRHAEQLRAEPPSDPDRWLYPWQRALPIAGTIAELYLAGRGLRFADPEGRVLRFVARRACKGPEGELDEHRPAMLAALSDVRTGEQCGIVNVYLKPNGSDRLRDKKGKTVTGRAKGAAVMLSDFDEPTGGLVICEGAETGIALLMADLAPVWACGGSTFLASFPLIGGIEALTIAADADANKAGQRAAAAVATRWREAGRETAIIAPPAGDWADSRKAAVA
jgi:DNA primase